MYMLLMSLDIWHWISWYEKFQIDKAEWRNYGSNFISTIKFKTLIHGNIVF
jgi:hypothetical protein